MRKLPFLITLWLAALLSGCGATPSHIIVSPQVTNKPTPVYQQQYVSLTINDLRANNHIVQILKKDKAAELYSPSQPLTQAINDSLMPYLNQQGLNTTGGNTVITIGINKAIVSVQQELMKYQANSDIQLAIEITKGDKTLTNVVNSKGSSNGPLKADIAVLERDLNQQLGKVISDIANNAELIEFIRN